MLCAGWGSRFLLFSSCLTQAFSSGSVYNEPRSTLLLLLTTDAAVVCRYVQQPEEAGMHLHRCPLSAVLAFEPETPYFDFPACRR